MRYLRLLLPIFPIMFIAVALLALVITGAGRSQIAQDWKDIILVISSGLLTLTGAYSNTLVQTEMQIQHETRDLRRRLTQPYREYLEWLVKLAHRTDNSMALKNRSEKYSKDLGQALEFSNEERRKLIEDMPPVWAHTLLDNKDLQEQLNLTFQLGADYVNQLDKSNRKKLENDLRTACIKSLKNLNALKYWDR